MSLYLTTDESYVPFRRPSIDIRGHSVAPDVLVALLDRPGEMHALTLKNQQFYTALKLYITETQGPAAWAQFEAIVYASRDEICDRDWIDVISEFLANNPVFLSKFKESVGYEDSDDDDYDGDNEDMTKKDEDHPYYIPTTISTTSAAAGAGGAKQMAGGGGGLPIVVENDTTDIPLPQRPRHQHPHARLLTLRDYPDIQSRLQLMCPAYFRKARHLMSLVPSAARSTAARRNSILDEEPADAENEHDEMVPRFDVCCYNDSGDNSPFDHFSRIVSTTRWDQPDDDAWIDAVLESLDGWPELLDDLKEIASSLDDDTDTNTDNGPTNGQRNHRKEDSPDAYIL